MTGWQDKCSKWKLSSLQLLWHILIPPTVMTTWDKINENFVLVPIEK